MTATAPSGRARRHTRFLVLALLAACAAPPSAAAGLSDLGPRVLVQVGGEAFAEYRRDAELRPVVWPILAPGGVAVTRAFPFATVVGEPQDHPHQGGLWLAHGLVNGIDFWSGKGRIVEVEHSLEADRGVVAGVSSWRGPDGREVCRDLHRYRFRGAAEWRAVDAEFTLIASDGDLELGDTKEGTFGLRLRPELCLRGERAVGTIRDSEGHQGLDVWGKRARWVAYAGEVQGQFLVVAMFDHPQNDGFPTWWHARDYGLLAANPFGQEAFTGAPPGTGTRRIPAGAQWQCRYRVWVARGRDALDRIDAAWHEWAGQR